MGDVSELRGLIVIISFLGVLVLLMGFMPTEIYSMGEEREIDVPEEWNGIPLRNLNLTDTWNGTLISTGSQAWDFGVGGRNLRLEGSYQIYGNYIKLFHRSGFGLLWTETMRWYNARGEERQYIEGQYGISKTILDEDYADFVELQYIVKSDWPFSVTSMFFFNNTAYNTPSEAWANDELNIFIGITWEHTSTVYNAWDVIAMLLFYRLPDINPIINSIIAIPIWIAVAYISFILILRAVGAIFGGGA